MAYTPSLQPNTRIDVADILRGIAIGGIGNSKKLD